MRKPVIPKPPDGQAPAAAAAAGTSPARATAAQAAAPATAPTTDGRLTLDPATLETVETLSDIPADTRTRFAALARVEDLAADHEITAFSVALLVEGDASVCATIVDEPVSHAQTGTLVPTRGTFGEAMGLRIVAGSSGARIAVWDQPVLDDVLRSCPWVLEEFAGQADRLQALAGATMGPLGDLDEATRNGVLERLGVLVALAGDAIDAEAAAAAVVGVGSVEVEEGGAPVVLRAGEVLFPRKDADSAKAGPQGAILLIGDSSVLGQLVAGPLALATLFAGG
jgi:hypothetical protein